MGTAPPLLEVRGLVSLYTTPFGPIRAVDGVDLDVAAGEVVAVVGESGCGKTALGLSLLGLMPGGAAAHPTGSIRLTGRELCGAPESVWSKVRGHEVAMIFQEPMTSLNPVMRVGQQVAEVLWLHGLATKREATTRAVAALAAVGIPDAARVATRYPHELSGGMRQRVMIAAATIAEPKLLIADEPTTALDVTIAAQILRLLLSMRERLGMGVVLITHDLGVVAETADRTVVMYAGEVVEQAPTATLFRSPRHPYTAGLIASMPRRGARGRLRAIAGNVPQAHERPAGCRFAPRCTWARDECRAADVPLLSWSSTQTTRCLFPDRVEAPL